MDSLLGRNISYQNAIDIFLDDGFESTHILKGVLEDKHNFIITLGNSEFVQQLWATKQGMPLKTALSDILLAQLEHHRADVFYNLDPVRFDDRILKRLPGCVKKSIAWCAAPTPHTRFQGYDLIVNNFPGILRRYEQLGCRTGFFFPAVAPQMKSAAEIVDRPIDIIFIGGYSRHHMRRNQILDSVAKMYPTLHVQFNLDVGRLNRLAEQPLIRHLKLMSRHCRSSSISAVSAPPLFGRELIEAIGKSKIVLNAAVDMAGEERGNIRCFEALGCGALLLSDNGTYPEGMEPDRTLVAYKDSTDAVKKASLLISDDFLRNNIASAGHKMISELYSKSRQMEAFLGLIS